ncbi:MAG: hypothetical protein ACRD2B_01400 [Terriglobia bacterium]
MKSRWNYAAVAVTVAASIGVTHKISLGRNLRCCISGCSAAFSERESRTARSGAVSKVSDDKASVIGAQQLPVLPNGVRLAIGGSMDKMRPGPIGNVSDPFRFPAQTQPLSLRPRVDPVKVERTMEQFDHLLKAVQPEIDEVSKGNLPRDLIPRLKRIEKLSKQLRREIEP